MTATQVAVHYSALQPAAAIRSPAPGATALLLLNWQGSFVPPTGQLHARAREVGVDLTSFVRALDQAGAHAQSVLAASRAAGLDIIHVRGATQLSTGYDATVRSLYLPPQDTADARWMDRLAPVETDLWLSSTSLSPFNSTRLDALLRNLGVEQLIIAGLLSNLAVELTASDARDLGYEVIVVEDACAALMPALHTGAMARLRVAGIPTAREALIAETLRTGAEWADLLPRGSPMDWPVVDGDPWPQLYPPGAEKTISLSGTVLVTVDMQVLNAHPEGSCGREAHEAGSNEFDWYFESISRILATVRAVQDSCRRADLPLLHLRTACQRADQQDSGRHRRPARGPMAALGTRDTQFLPEVAPKADELVISKTSWGAFNSSEIERYLRALSARHLIIVGVVTNGCVELTARDALDRGFDVTVVSDATTARTAALHDDALHRLRVSGAQLRTAEALREELRGRCGRDGDRAPHNRPELR